MSTLADTHACRDDVVRCAAQHLAASDHDRHRTLVTPFLHGGDDTGRRRCTAGGAHDLVPDADLLDTPATVRGHDQRVGWKALVRVPHHADVAVLLAQQHDQVVLHGVGVLVLVDQHVAEPVAVVLEHVGLGLEQLHGDGQQVVEVHRTGAVQAQLVLGVDLRDLAVVDVGRLLPVGVEVDAVVLGSGDGRVHRSRREPTGVDVEVAQHVRGETHRVGLVVDRERRGVTQPLGVATQDPHAGGVERRHPHLLGDRTDEPADALSHLGGGLVGEGDGQDLERRHTMLVDEMGDPVREHAGLAGAGSRDDEQGPLGVGHRLVLGGVEAFEQRIPHRRLVGRCSVGRHRSHTTWGI